MVIYRGEASKQFCTALCNYHVIHLRGIIIFAVCRGDRGSGLVVGILHILGISRAVRIHIKALYLMCDTAGYAIHTGRISRTDKTENPAPA